jgi:thymidylate synthase (FAD)
MMDAISEIKVGSDGFVRLMAVYGSEADILQAARVSYSKKKSSDRTLLRYLLRHRHTTPFEMADVVFWLRVPIDVWRQGVRHRTASQNEYSQRYREAINAADVPNMDEWRRQSTTNKQGSEELMLASVGSGFTSSVNYAIHTARKTYQMLLNAGVAREQARRHLPLCTYTELYWKIDLHNLMHFLKLRMDSHAQQEIREFANSMYEQIKPVFPTIMEAFEQYSVQAITLTALDILAISVGDWAGQSIVDERERSEYLAKIQALNLGGKQ